MPSNLATKKHRHSQTVLDQMTMAVMRGDLTIAAAADEYNYDVGTVRRYVRTARLQLSDVDQICVTIVQELARRGKRSAV